MWICLIMICVVSMGQKQVGKLIFSMRQVPHGLVGQVFLVTQQFWLILHLHLQQVGLIRFLPVLIILPAVPMQ